MVMMQTPKVTSMVMPRREDLVTFLAIERELFHRPVAPASELRDERQPLGFQDGTRPCLEVHKETAYSAAGNLGRLRSSKGPAMTREEITAMFNRREAAWQAHDAIALAADHAADAVVISPTGGVLEGREDIHRIYQVWFTAFPDLHFAERDLLIDGDRVALIMTLEGTHAGDFFGLPASGRHVKAVCAFIYTIKNNQIVHERRILDFTGVLVQVGVIRAKPAAGL